MKEFRGDLLSVGLDCKGAQKNFLDTTTNVARIADLQYPPEGDRDEEEGEGAAALSACKSSLRHRWESVVAYLEENRQNIFYLIVFYVITIALFVERFMRKYCLCQRGDGICLIQPCFKKL
jgi:dual oxidase